MLAFDPMAEKQSNLGSVLSIFSLWEWLVQSYAARLVGNIFLNFVPNLSLGGGNWVLCLWHQHLSKMGYFKYTILFNICTISFLSCYGIGCTIIRYHIYGFCWSPKQQQIGATKPIFLDSGPLGGRVVCACMGKVCSKYIVHILKSIKTLFSLTWTAICAELRCQTTWGHIPVLCVKLEP